MGPVRGRIVEIPRKAVVSHVEQHIIPTCVQRRTCSINIQFVHVSNKAVQQYILVTSRLIRLPARGAETFVTDFQMWITVSLGSEFWK